MHERVTKSNNNQRKGANNQINIAGHKLHLDVVNGRKTIIEIHIKYIVVRGHI